MANSEEKPNTKEQKLDAYFQREGLNFFHKRNVKDDSHTVLYLTAIPAGTHRLLTAIITDNSIYTIVRCHLGTRFPQTPGNDRFLEFVRKLNANHAFFKYAVNQDGGLYLDVCLPAADAYFDPNMVRTTMNLLVYHMKDTYPEILKWLDRPGDAEEEVNG